MFYIIVTSGERSVCDEYIATTLEECEQHLMEFASFYCPHGCASIKVVDNYFHTIEYRHYDEGKLKEVRKYQ